MTENVIVQLHDLHSNDNHCLSMLKTKLRESTNDIAFSLQWKPLSSISKSNFTTTPSDSVEVFDVEVVNDQRDLLIFGNESKLEFFNLKTRTLKKSVQLNITTTIHEIVVDGDYLYLTISNGLIKYKLNSLLEEGIVDSKAVIWENTSIGNNLWGLAIHEMNSKKYAFVMDYGVGVFVCDTETGRRVEMKVPIINSGYGIAFTEENEMIVSTSNSSNGPLQIYTFENDKWQLLREAERNEKYSTSYGIHYERKTKLIYVVDTRAQTVFVFNKETMQVVHEWHVLSEWNECNIYGITINSKTGHLYLPIDDDSIQILN